MQRQLYTCLYNNCNPEPFEPGGRYDVLPCGDLFLTHLHYKTRANRTKDASGRAFVLQNTNKSITFAHPRSRSATKHEQIKANAESQAALGASAVYEWVTRTRKREAARGI